jgi:hypothetical protein
MRNEKAKQNKRRQKQDGRGQTKKKRNITYRDHAVTVIIMIGDIWGIFRHGQFSFVDTVLVMLLFKVGPKSHCQSQKQLVGMQFLKQHRSNVLRGFVCSLYTVI